MPYTVDHFSNNKKRWEKHVTPLKPQRSMVIGAHEGRAPQWLLDHIPRSTVICVDDYKKLPAKVFTNAKANMAPYGSRATLINQPTRDALLSMTDTFDFIFIDSVDSQKVLEALILAFPLLKPKGLCIADDYTSSAEHLPNCPKQAIDAFLSIYAPYVKTLELSWQAIFQRRSKKLPWKYCNSEYYTS